MKPISENGEKTRVALIHLGCAKNLIDSEIMLGILSDAGVELVPEASRADVIVVNTCSFIDEAKEEAVTTILEAAKLKEGGKCKRLVVAGCLVQHHGRELEKLISEIDCLLPINKMGKIAEACTRDEPVRFPIEEATSLPDHTSPRLITTGPWSAYLRIADGCDNRCAYCTIPSIRGKLRSRSRESLLLEAEKLAGRGIVELNLVAQDCTSYGREKGSRNGLVALLRDLESVEGIQWIRMLYAHPEKIDGRLLDALSRPGKLCKYLDLPFQHASRKILEKMGRRKGGEELLETVETIRKKVPGIVLRTTFITGFPGEGDAEFTRLADFLKAARFDHVGVFTYSPQEGTPSYELGDPIPEEEKRRRKDLLLSLQSKIALEKNRDKIGRVLKVLLDPLHPDAPGGTTGRWEGQAPEIDGTVTVEDIDKDAGPFVNVEIIRAGSYDLKGRIKDER